MNIGFDVSDLCTDRADGTTRYTRELARRLPELSSGHQWHFFAPCPRDSSGLHTSSNMRWVSSSWPKYWTQTRLPFDLHRLRPDVLFMPIQQIPYLRPRGMRTVAVVHDLAVHRYPEQFTYKDWLLLHVFSAYVARVADHIIAVSRATADDIAQYYGRTDDVHVVHHGVDHALFRPLRDRAEREASWQVLLESYATLRNPYILFVGQIQPRKNIARLVGAFEQLADRPELRDHQLVIAGSHGWLQRSIHERIERSPMRERIVMTGRVPDELLLALYQHAAVFVLPSLYEGFGMPVLEAMACGCPVVASNISSLPEVAGDAAVLVDPLDEGSIAEGIRWAVQERDVLSARGIERAQQFTWDATAQETLRVVTQSR